MMQKEKRCRVRKVMIFSESGTQWLAGQSVVILEEKDDIIKVQGLNPHKKDEACWINRWDTYDEKEQS